MKNWHWVFVWFRCGIKMCCYSVYCKIHSCGHKLCKFFYTHKNCTCENSVRCAVNMLFTGVATILLGMHSWLTLIPPSGGIFTVSFWMSNCLKFIQHCLICRPSDVTVSEDAEIEPRTVATFALAVRRSNNLARSHPPLHSLLYMYYVLYLYVMNEPALHMFLWLFLQRAQI